MDTLARFERALVWSGRSKQTRRLYLGAVRRWLAFGGVAGHVDSETVWRFLGARRQVLAPRSLNIELAALRAFYRAMAAIGVAADGTAVGIPATRRVPARITRWYTDSEAQAIIAQPNASTWVGQRDRIVLRTLYETGLRSGELAALTLGAILPDGMLFVAGDRRRRDRYVPITPELQQALQEWIRVRRIAQPGKKSALFVTRSGRALGARSFWRIVAEHATNALGSGGTFNRLRGSGTPWRGHSPHVMRSSTVVQLLASDMPITAVAQMLGHASVATTATYEAADLAPLREAIGKMPARQRHDTNPKSSDPSDSAADIRAAAISQLAAASSTPIK